MHDRGSIRNVHCGMLRSWRSATPWINALDRFAMCRPQHCNSIGSIHDVLICNVAEVSVDCRRRYHSLSKRHSPSKRHPPQKKRRRRDGARPKKGSANNVNNNKQNSNDDGGNTREEEQTTSHKPKKNYHFWSYGNRVVISQKATLNIFLK